VPATATPPPAPRIWWRDAVFYEIFVRSFSDSNGDGTGDFNGITQKLDYLQSLGVTALWLMPIQPSPSYHGYDVLNYYAVNPQYGSMDDFKALLKAAHEHKMRVIIDLVLNHTSSQHPWFVDANSSPQSKYRDWYVWSDTSQGKLWFQGNGGFYYSAFTKNMPDLNYRNPAVTAQMEKMSAYWLKDIGVDGFRIDAAKHLIEEGAKLENTAATHEWLKGFTTFYKTESPQAYVVGEVGGMGSQIAKTYNGQMDEIFNFELASATVQSVAGGGSSSVISYLKFALRDKPDGNYATFLTNHDQVRPMSRFGGDINKAKLAAALLLTAPGTPFIYYGEEIGMLGQKPDEDIRLPMQWTADSATAGFTSGVPWRKPNASTVATNVSMEDKDPASLLNYYRALIALRKSTPALETGSLALLDTGSTTVFASLRQEGEQIILVLVNLSKESVTDYNLSLPTTFIPDGVYQPETIFGKGNAGPLTVSAGKFNAYQPLAQLAPQSVVIFKLK
jgi:glycosidase